MGRDVVFEVYAPSASGWGVVCSRATKYSRQMLYQQDARAAIHVRNLKTGSYNIEIVTQAVSSNRYDHASLRG